jgi:hypothetical protein
MPETLLDRLGATPRASPEPDVGPVVLVSAAGTTADTSTSASAELASVGHDEAGSERQQRQSGGTGG